MTDIKDALLAEQQKGQTENTAARTAQKEKLTESWGVRGAIGLALLIIIFFLAGAGNWNFFWLLAVSAGLWYAGSMLAGIKGAKAILWHWPATLQGIAIAIAVVTVGTSGFTKLFAVGANNAEEAADCYADPNQTKCKANDEHEATPGTTEVTDTQFIGEAHGETYTIRDDTWSIFTWTDGYCLRQFGGSGLLERSNDRANTYSFLSPKSNQKIEVKLVPAGESWHNDVC